MWFPAAALLLLLAQPPDFGAEGLKALEAQKYAEAARVRSCKKMSGQVGDP